MFRSIRYIFIFTLLIGCTESPSDSPQSANPVQDQKINDLASINVDTIDFEAIAATYNRQEDLLYQYCYVHSEREHGDLNDLRRNLKRLGFDVKINKIFKEGSDAKDETYFYSEIRGVPTPKDPYYKYTMYDDNEAVISGAYQVINIDFPDGLKQLQKEIGSTSELFLRHNAHADTTLNNPIFPRTRNSFFNTENSRLLYFFLTRNNRFEDSEDNEGYYDFNIEDEDTSLMEFLNLRQHIEPKDYKRYFRLHDLDGTSIPKIYITLNDIHASLIMPRAVVKMPLIKWTFGWDGEYSCAFPYGTLRTPIKSRKNIDFDITSWDDVDLYKDMAFPSMVPGILPLNDTIQLNLSPAPVEDLSIKDVNGKVWKGKSCDVNEDGISDIIWIVEDLSDRHWFRTHVRLYVNINGRWVERYRKSYHEF